MNWDDRSLSGIGIPGRIGRYQFGVASVSEGDDNLSSFTDRKDFVQYISVFPFSELKNKWLQGLCSSLARGSVTSISANRRTTVAPGYASRITVMRAGRRSLTPAQTPSARACLLFLCLASPGAWVPIGSVPCAVSRIFKMGILPGVVGSRGDASRLYA